MTREQMIAEVEHLFAMATEEQRTIPLVQDVDRTWNFTQIIEQVRMATQVGLHFIDIMIDRRQQRNEQLN